MRASQGWFGYWLGGCAVALILTGCSSSSAASTSSSVRPTTPMPTSSASASPAAAGGSLSGKIIPGAPTTISGALAAPFANLVKACATVPVDTMCSQGPCPTTGWAVIPPCTQLPSTASAFAALCEPLVGAVLSVMPVPGLDASTSVSTGQYQGASPEVPTHRYVGHFSNGNGPPPTLAPQTPGQTSLPPPAGTGVAAAHCETAIGGFDLAPPPAQLQPAHVPLVRNIRNLPAGLVYSRINRQIVIRAGAYDMAGIHGDLDGYTENGWAVSFSPIGNYSITGVQLESHAAQVWEALQKALE